MKNFRSLVEDASDKLQLPLDQVALLCTENKLSLTQRFRLKEVIRIAKARKRVQHFSEFIKIINSNVGQDEKFRKLFSLMAESHVKTQSMMKERFVSLAGQNMKLKE